MPAKPKSNSKRERDGASSAKRKKGDKAKQPAAPVSTAPSVNEIKLPDKYRLLPAPRLDPLAAAQDGSLVLLSRIARAPQITLREDSLTAVGCKGYRMVRATHGVKRGGWYFEVRVHEPMNGEDAHCRLGWATEMGELQAPVGYDTNSYSYRDIGGTKFHESIGGEYGEAYGPGDVIGCELVMGDPPARVRRQQRISIKGVEYIVEEEVERTVSVGSRISFYKNGVCQGVAFSDVWAEVYYPAAGLYKSAVVEFNFGPHFEFPPKESSSRPMSEIPTIDGGKENHQGEAEGRGAEAMVCKPCSDVEPAKPEPAKPEPAKPELAKPELKPEIAAEAEAGKADALEQVESKAQIEGEAISNGDGS